MYKKKYSNKFSVAPMLNYTDQYCRYFYRQLTKKTLLYTEMITSQELLYKNPDNYIRYTSNNQNPIAIQLAGNNINELTKCAMIAYSLGFNEINLNAGCPSKKAQLGGFGACLMLNPILLFNIIRAIYNTVPIPISIKIRLGTHNKNNYQHLYNFIKLVSKKNYCKRFIIHARIANLNGLNTKKNRCIPPLNYKYVYKIKKDFPNLKIILNGGIQNLQEAQKHLKIIDGVMLGRAIYKNPLMLCAVDQKIFSVHSIINKKILLDNMQKYIHYHSLKNIPIIYIFRHMLNIFYGKPQSKKLKQYFIHKIKNYTDITILFQKLSKKFNF
ncbi:tRNA-dihydrouridine synthase A [Buchnera aphidicola (Cinara tujafilina)]|uniref:tRNA-dihydrouridine synthase A n=1 Tax=Buchnera aphidicola (Cinara tujafilina) TaxID=261317 RepID=F7WZQ7_9GAMM|nr:tRNA dihydrouridine(20/20a) synthase DusA [Buchnera aphidicola]AEH39933.1 tRNA-dihydrouridine synthase A [Buchnera aphidicola (Cinara tujafilina)]